jgi:hypothetical protein
MNQASRAKVHFAQTGVREMQVAFDRNQNARGSFSRMLRPKLPV